MVSNDNSSPLKKGRRRSSGTSTSLSPSTTSSAKTPKNSSRPSKDIFSDKDTKSKDNKSKISSQSSNYLRFIIYIGALFMVLLFSGTFFHMLLGLQREFFFPNSPSSNSQLSDESLPILELDGSWNPFLSIKQISKGFFCPTKFQEQYPEISTGSNFKEFFGSFSNISYDPRDNEGYSIGKQLVILEEYIESNRLEEYRHNLVAKVESVLQLHQSVKNNASENIGEVVVLDDDEESFDKQTEIQVEELIEKTIEDSKVDENDDNDNHLNQEITSSFSESLDELQIEDGAETLVQRREDKEEIYWQSIPVEEKLFTIENEEKEEKEIHSPSAPVKEHVDKTENEEKDEKEGEEIYSPSIPVENTIDAVEKVETSTIFKENNSDEVTDGRLENSEALLPLYKKVAWYLYHANESNKEFSPSEISGINSSLEPINAEFNILPSPFFTSSPIHPFPRSISSPEFWHFFHLDKPLYDWDYNLIAFIHSPTVITRMSAPIKEGSCYPLRKNNGRISWSTKGMALKAFSYQHVLPKTKKPMNFNLTYSSAPSEMVLYGYKDLSAYIQGLLNEGTGRTELAKMHFSITNETDNTYSNHWQYNSDTEEFSSLKTVLIENQDQYKYFNIEIEGNHGFEPFTCLYRFYFWA